MSFHFGKKKTEDQTNKLYFLELVRFSGHPRPPPGWYNSEVKEILARNPSVCIYDFLQGNKIYY